MPRKKRERVESMLTDNATKKPTVCDYYTASDWLTSREAKEYIYHSSLLFFKEIIERAPYFIGLYQIANAKRYNIKSASVEDAGGRKVRFYSKNSIKSAHANLTKHASYEDLAQTVRSRHLTNWEAKYLLQCVVRKKRES